MIIVSGQNFSEFPETFCLLSLLLQAMKEYEIPIEAMPDFELITKISKVFKIKHSNGKELDESKSATGFFYEHKGSIYFVTNWHVVTDIDPTKRPDALSLRLHSREGISEAGEEFDLRINEDYEIDLYENGQKIWHEDPQNTSISDPFKKIDIAVIPLNKEEVMKKFAISCFCRDNLLASNIPVYLGEDLMVLGYPLGLCDELNNLPIARNATIASPYSVPYNGDPCFLIDARLHSGTSGSPILTKPSTPKFIDGKWALPMPSYACQQEERKLPSPSLIGLMSTCFCHWDERLEDVIGLSKVFHAYLIPKIIDSNKALRANRG